MEDIEVAKTLIQAIIKQEIVELIPVPLDSNALALKIKYAQMEILRQDYVAIIKTIDIHGNQQTEKVVIEV